MELTQWEIEQFSDIGGRDENQDRSAIFSDRDTGIAFIVVADGMGGHSGGSLAAETIVKMAEKLWQDRQSEAEPETFLNNFVLQSHIAINEAEKESGLTPRSTVAALWLDSERAISIHVGDSRILQFGPDGYIKRSIDHSIAQLHVLQGKITEEEMATHPDQSKMTTSMGGPEDPASEITHWSLDEGSSFIICSDGFWEIVFNDQMQEILTSPSMEDELVKTSRRHIGMAPDDHDNTTAVAVRKRAGQAATNAQTNSSSSWVPIILLAIAIIAAYFWLSNDKPVSSVKPEQSEKTVPADSIPTPIKKPAQAPVPDTTQTETDTATPEKEAEPVNEKPAETGNEQAPGEENTQPEQQSTPPVMIQSVAPTNDTTGKREEDDKKAEDPVSKQDDIKMEPNIPVGPNDNVPSKVTDHLKKKGAIGKHDKVEQTSVPDMVINKTKLGRLQQKYKGIPVSGAVISTVQKGGKITTIQGKLSSDINISVKPKLTYKQAIDKLNTTANPKFKPLDKGRLVILKHQDVYVLCWTGVVMSGSEEVIYLDSTTAKILLRLPATLNKE